MTTTVLNPVMSNSGVMLAKAKENDECCKENSISTTEDGTNIRWPLVSLRQGGCYGGVSKSFQQWVDDVVESYPQDGLCIDEWLYVKSFMSTSGNVLGMAKKNVDCCVQSYIETSEDGTEVRWPLVSADDDKCYGGYKQSFQQWANDAMESLPQDGLCVDGWLYVFGGIFIKSNVTIFLLLPHKIDTFLLIFDSYTSIFILFVVD